MKDSSESVLYGLVMAGGKSQRMKKDKAAIQYHGTYQSQYCYELLLGFCEQVFLSNRKEQINDKGHKGFQQLHDKEPFYNIGPLGGIMTAMNMYPHVDWLVLACDLPFVNHYVISHLIRFRNPKKLATAYLSAHDGSPEPLCAIYERHAAETLRAFYDQGIVCPRKVLANSNVELLALPDKKALDNVNSPDEYFNAFKKLEQKNEQKN